MKLKSILGILSISALFSTLPADSKIDLEIEYPEKLVKGTEVPKNIPNLEKSRAKDTAPAAFKGSPRVPAAPAAPQPLQNCC